MNATAELLSFAGAEHRLPADVRARALELLADTLAVGAAGALAPGAGQIRAVAQAMGSGDDSRLIGFDARLPAPSAAFFNGYCIHCLEWDAVHEPAVVHALSTVLAALGAAIDRKGECDPEDAITALAVGVDIAAGLGLAACGPLKFFRPATAGVIGAALAVARIDGAPLRDALGIAYSSAAGTMQAHVEGLATLPFQIANAARAAVIASDLAATGFPGPRDPLEGEFGYFALFEQGDLATYVQDIGRIWRLSEVSVKPYPSGRASHALLAAIEGLKLDPSKVRSVTAVVPPLVHRLIGRPYRSDMTAAYARLCGPFLAALMILDGRIDPRRFTRETFCDPQVAKLVADISIVRDDNPDPNALSPQEVLVETNGDRIMVEIPHTLGSPDNPMNEQQRLSKFRLARELSPPSCDPRVFDDPLGYFTVPQ